MVKQFLSVPSMLSISNSRISHVRFAQYITIPMHVALNLQCMWCHTEYMWNSTAKLNQLINIISIAHVIIIIKSEVSTFPIVIVFSAVVCLRCLLYHILSLVAYPEFVFIIIVQFMMSAHIRIRFGLQIVLVYLYSTPSHYYHCANLSEGIDLIKCLSDLFVECLSKIKHILSVIHYTICGTVCFRFTHFSCDDWENIYTLS